MTLVIQKGCTDYSCYVSLTRKTAFELHQSPYIYRTVDKPSTGIYREKGSKFLSFAFPVASEEDIQKELDKLKKKYHDARHHCYAWIVGFDGTKFRAFDDGEPKHSAGDPILGQIRSNELTNVLIAVVRYFGGVKLGVGGLVNAYRMAAGDALANATLVEKEVLTLLTIEYDFRCTPEIMRLVKEFNLDIGHQSFETKAKLKATVSLANKPAVVERLELLQNLKLDIQFVVE